MAHEPPAQECEQVHYGLFIMSTSLFVTGSCDNASVKLMCWQVQQPDSIALGATVILEQNIQIAAVSSVLSTNHGRRMLPACPSINKTVLISPYVTLASCLQHI